MFRVLKMFISAFKNKLSYENYFPLIYSIHMVDPYRLSVQYYLLYYPPKFYEEFIYNPFIYQMVTLKIT